MSKTYSRKSFPTEIVFHNLDHAKYVVEGTEFIGKGHGLCDEDLNIAKICAWFHDVGFIVDPANHEKEGVKIASEFLTSKEVVTRNN